MTQKLSDTALNKLTIALAIYLTSLFAANTLGLKIMPFLFHSHLTVGVFSFPIVFLMTDVIGEVYGKHAAKLFVLAGAISTILFILYSLVSIAMPWSHAGLWAKDGYNLIFGVSVRISIASVVAFVIGEYQDIIAFTGIYSWPVLVSVTLTLWLYKIAMGFLYTPLSYIGIYLLRDHPSNQN